MEVDEQVKSFKEFIEGYYMEDLIAQIAKDNHFLLFDFKQLMTFSPDLANLLLEMPEEVIKAAEIAIVGFDTLGDTRGFKARFFNLPVTQQKQVWELRSKDIGKFVPLKGNVNKLSNIIHLCISARFECHKCGNIINMLFHDEKFKSPKICGCGGKSGFRLLDKEMVDLLKMGIADDLLEKENRERNVAREKLAVLKKDLAGKDIDSEIKPGKKVIVNGYLRYIQKKEDSAEFDSVFEVNSIEFAKVGWGTVILNKKEEEHIKSLSSSKDILQRLAESISDMQGNESVKLACLLQLAGAPNIYDSNKELASRGTIHILLVGDPGVNKTFFAKRAGSISPIYSFQSAATASGKGLVASVNQDKELGLWMIYPGVVVICHKGICVIDEIDKTHPDDYGHHNNAMNDMKVPVAKANVKGILDAETSYLSTANPENRVFTSYGSYFSQIDMPKDFLDRYDLIFPIVAPDNEEIKDRIMDVMLERHDSDNNDKIWNPEFSHDYLRKYIGYCRKANPNPIMPKSIFPVIKEKFKKLMKPIDGGYYDSQKDEERIKISYRHLESITRLAYGAARLKLTDVDESAIDIAFKLKRDSMIKLKLIDEHGYNWGEEERIDTKGISDKEIVKEIIKELMGKLADIIPIDDIVDVCEGKGVDKDKTEEIIEKMKMGGSYFEPRRGFLGRL